MRDRSAMKQKSPFYPPIYYQPSQGKPSFYHCKPLWCLHRCTGFTILFNALDTLITGLFKACHKPLQYPLLNYHIMLAVYKCKLLWSLVVTDKTLEVSEVRWFLSDEYTKFWRFLKLGDFFVMNIIDLYFLFIWWLQDHNKDYIVEFQDTSPSSLARKYPGYKHFSADRVPFFRQGYKVATIMSVYWKCCANFF
jgi:hypothetical protein